MFVPGVLVAIVVQLERSGLVCNVRRKYGVVLRTTVAELATGPEMTVKMGAAGMGRLPPVPLNVTAPVCTSALPFMVELAFMVMEAYAMMVPLKTEEVPSVAELPTCQKMFLAWAPPVKITLPLTATVSVLAI